MILVKVTYSFSNIIEMSFDGHADYDEEGKDIVCAGVSACFLGGASSLEEENKFELSYSKGKGKIIVKDELNEHDKIVLEVIYKQIKLIADTYPENVKLIKQERK